MTLGNAKLAPEQLFGNSTPSVRLLGAVMRKLRALYPAKTAANIAVRAGVKTRTAEYWLSEKAGRDMSAEAFLSLLVSEDGGQILAAIMAELPAKRRPEWWRRHANSVRLAAVVKAQAEADAEIRQLQLELMGK